MPFILLLISLFFTACKNPPQLQLSTGEKIDLRLALTLQEQTRGLSGVRAKDFSTKEGMLFVYKNSEPRRFWMPDTYFDLEIIFLSGDLTVIDIERNVPHHPGKETPPEIYTTRTIMAQHVLEIRSDSPLAKKITIGSQLKCLGACAFLVSKEH